jgi:hypothetical protein
MCVYIREYVTITQNPKGNIFVIHLKVMSCCSCLFELYLYFCWMIQVVNGNVFICHDLDLFAFTCIHVCMHLQVYVPGKYKNRV